MSDTYNITLRDGPNTITVTVGSTGTGNNRRTLVYTITITRATPPPADATVEMVSVSNSPTAPGAASQITIMFRTESRLMAGTDRIMLDIDSSFGIPTSLPRSQVRVSANDVSGGNPNQSIMPSLDPVYRLIPGGEGRVEYTITVPSMDAEEGAAVSNIDAGAMVTVTILSGSGFTNPTERNTGGDDFTVSTSEQMTGVPAEIRTELTLTIDDKADNRDKPLTVTGKGFKDGTTAIVYLDKDKDGQRGPGDVDLFKPVVESDDTFTATFNVTVPPFETLPEKNRINAIDSEVPPNHYNGKGMYSAVEFEVEGLVQVNPTTAAVGDDIQISLKDWPSGFGNPLVTIGDQSHTVRSTGADTYEVTIGNEVPSGTVQLKFEMNGESDTTNLVISGAVLTVTPTTVVPNQSITVVGSGFGEQKTINKLDDQSSVTIGTDPTNLGPGSINFNNGNSITTDSGGNWNASVVVPLTSASTTTGTHELRVKDSSGREGSALITVPARTITLDPAEARPGDTVDLTGTGFPASTSKAVEATPPVMIEYDGRSVGTATPDASGNIAYRFRVPLNSAIPSTNTVRTTYRYGSANTPVSDTVVHRVPGARITLSASEGRSGSKLTVSGDGFKSFTSVETVTIGDIDVTPAPKPATGNQGEFSTTVLVPQLDTGTHSVEAKFGGTVASAIFKITDQTISPTTMVMEAEAATPEVAFAAVIAEDNLITVYHFDPATQNEAPDYGYSTYDARPLFMSGNNLDTIEPGKIYTIEVSEDQTSVTLGSQTVDLYARFTQIQW